METTTQRVIEVGDADFAERVLAEPLPVLVEFWAPWCGPCRMLAPVLDQIAAERAGSLVVAKLNTDQNVEVPSRYGVLAAPTLALFRGGEPERVVVGARSKARLLRDLGL